MRGHRHGWRGRRPLGWLLAKGIHRTVVAFLLVTAVLGALGGAALHAALERGASASGVLCVAAGAFLAVWPMAWLATMRIARPLRELATVAMELHEGRLQSRERLPGGPTEVGEVGDALRGLAERVTRQLRDQRALMAAVSHELRSPLGRARVLVELARDGVGPPGVHDELQGEIDAMDQLIGDLLAAARIDFEAVSPRDLDAHDVAGRALQIAGLPAETLSGEAARVRADPTLLARALAVLLDNARRYGGRHVTIAVARDGGRVRFVVEDDGPGFAPGDEERAFQPFWRGPMAAPRGEGLGLALVRQIAEAHGGEAGAGNRPEGGARVWVALPAATDSEA